MNYITIPPPPSLADHVRFFWVLECEISSGNPYIQRTTADGCAELIFHYKGQFDELLPDENSRKSFLSGFHGQSGKFRRFTIDKNFGIFGVYLFPHAIPCLFATPASKLTDSMTDLKSFLGREGENLEEQVMLAKNNKQRIQIVSEFLSSRLLKQNKSNPPICSAIRYIIKNKGQVNIENLSAQYSLSRRQFERTFKHHAGIRPKLYSRIVRFQSVFNELTIVKPSLTEIAHKCGYYDQSHFIHEFRQFSGFNPAQYLKDTSTETTIWTA